MSKDTIDQRIQQVNLVLNENSSTQLSPQVEHEIYSIGFIIKISQCYHSITTLEDLQLTNGLIKRLETGDKAKKLKIEV